MGAGQSTIEKDQISQIMDDFLSGKLKKPLYKNYPHTVEKRSDELVDDNREFKDLCTDIIVKQFLSSDQSMFNFLTLVYGTFQNAIEQYKQAKGLSQWDIFFVYKGGNILRIISNDFLRELPRASSKIITDYYEQFFKRSDADFSIYVNPVLENYEAIHSDMTFLSYLLQVYIRRRFSSNLTDYFELFKYSREYKTQLLLEYFQKGSLANSFKNPANKTFYGAKLDKLIFLDIQLGTDSIRDQYEGKYDMAQEITAKGKVASFDLDKVRHGMYIQMNQSLDFSSPSGRIKFNLVRTKVNFNFLFTMANGSKTKKSIGGELIDVSIPHRLDNNLAHFYEEGAANYIQQYRLTFGSKILEFLSYKYSYLAHDLEFILFQFVRKPWQTPKYDKRLNRLFYLYVIDLFIKLPTISERKNIILDLLNRVFKVQLDMDNLLTTGKEVIDGIEYYMIKYSKNNLLITRLLKEMRRIILHELETVDDIDNYNLMCMTLLQNCNIMNLAFKGVRTFCSEEGNLNVETLYDNDFKALIGGRHIRKHF